MIAEVVDDLVDPAVYGAREPDLQLRGDQHLAERVRQRQPQELQLVAAEQVEALDRCGLVGPVAVRELDALGLARRARGVDEGREVVVGDRGVGAGDGVGIRGEQRAAAGREVVEGDHPVVTTGGEVDRGGVDEHDLLDAGQRLALLDELGQLGAVLGDDEARAGVAEDEGDVLRVGRRVDRGGGAGREHDGEVGEDPLEPGRHRDRDALLGLETQREEAGSELGDPLATAPPAPGLPATARGGRAEGLAGGVGGDAGEEQRTQRRGRLRERLGRGGRATRAGDGRLCGGLTVGHGPSWLRSPGCPGGCPRVPGSVTPQAGPAVCAPTLPRRGA